VKSIEDGFGMPWFFRFGVQRLDGSVFRLR
jgi:hypothetical protein